jgi:hypothetical protein
MDKIGLPRLVILECPCEVSDTLVLKCFSYMLQLLLLPTSSAQYLQESRNNQGDIFIYEQWWYAPGYTSCLHKTSPLAKNRSYIYLNNIS